MVPDIFSKPQDISWPGFYEISMPYLISWTSKWRLNIGTTTPMDSFLIEFQLFSERMESPHPGALPRIGVLRVKDLVCFMYFELIFIILKRIYEKYSSFTVLKQS